MARNNTVLALVPSMSYMSNDQLRLALRSKAESLNPGLSLSRLSKEVWKISPNIRAAHTSENSFYQKLRKAFEGEIRFFDTEFELYEMLIPAIEKVRSSWIEKVQKLTR